MYPCISPEAGGGNESLRRKKAFAQLSRNCDKKIMSDDFRKQIEEIRGRLGRPVVLIGMMGAGKTRIGRGLAAALELPFFDSDDEIEKAAGMKIADIFEKFGEAYFRDGERRVIRRLIEGGAGVISTGGGAVMTPETGELVWSQAISIWVRAEIPVMLERALRTGRRPLLKGDNPEAIMAALAEKRYPIYEKADIAVDSHGGPPEAVLEQALGKLHDFLT
jgi:shikimate kinase